MSATDLDTTTLDYLFLARVSLHRLRHETKETAESSLRKLVELLEKDPNASDR